MSMNADKPSQAEGEDPDRPEDGEVLPEDGHPSQAEGEDPEAEVEHPQSQGEDTTPA